MLDFIHKVQGKNRVKLKLEMQQNVAILSVLESVVVQDVAVLRAGLNKIFQSGRKSVVVDLTGLSEGSLGDGAASELVQLGAWAASLEGQVIIASPIAAVGQAPDREKAVALLGTNIAKLLANEARLNSQIKTLQARKAQLEKALGAAQGGGTQDAQALKQEAYRLKQLVESLESQIKLLMKDRKDPFLPNDTLAKKRDTLNDTVISILRERGMIPNG